VAQFVANAIIATANIALLAVAFQLIYRTRRAFDFSFSTLYVATPYAVLALNRWGGLSFWQAVVSGLAIALVLAYVFESTLYRALRRRQASALVVMLASFGLYIVAQNAIAVLFGNEARTLRDWGIGRALEFGGARFTTLQAVSLLCVLVGMSATIAFQHLTRIGRLLRAVSSNPELAVAVGIRVDRVVLAGSLTATILIGIAAVMVGLETDLIPTMGFPALLVAVTACILGGIGSVGGALAGAAIIALAQQSGTWILGAQWTDATTYALLFAVLVFRRSSLFAGPKLRYGT
jgi:branched-chain amino acid transport system permease protein